MSESNTSQKTEFLNPTLETRQVDESQIPPKVEPEKITLWGEIKKGWDWVVFSWSMLQRIGGFRELAQTFYVVVSMLIQRTLIQWGVIKKK
jgi:hypothetical protein